MTDDAVTVSATFKEAMNTLTALREVEKSKKNDEFRARLAIADLTMSLDRVEQLWNNGILKRGGGEDKGPSPHQQQQHPFPVVAGTSGSSTDTQHQHHDPNAITTPPVLSPPVSNSNSTTAAGGVGGGSANSSTSSKPSAALSHFAATVATLHERLEAIAEGMSSVLAAAAKGLPSPSLSIPQAASDEQVLVTITSASSAGDNGSFDKAGRGPLSSPQKQQQQQENNSDAPFATAPTSTTLSPSLRSRGPPVVTLLPAPEESFASPTTSGCFSPRGQRSRGSISISDSVSFIPEELFRPDASDMVSRGTMTKVVLTASTAVQSSSKGMSAEEAQLLRYVQLLEAYCTKEQLEEARKSAKGL